MKAAVNDMIQGAAGWRKWTILAWRDVHQRYRRTMFGQFWVTLSMTISIAGIAAVYAVLFHVSLSVYLPYVGLGIIIWSLISGLLIEGCGAFTSADAYLKNFPGPRSIVVYRVVLRNLIVFLHNAILIPIIDIGFQIRPGWIGFLVIPSLLALVVNGFFASVILGGLSARYPDVPQMVQNLVLLAFLLSPVIYEPTQDSGILWALANINPFANFVEIIRSPLLGNMPSLHHYGMVAIYTFVLAVGAVVVLGRFRGRLHYWL